MTTTASTAPQQLPLRQRHLLSRIVASLVGGWVFVWGCATLGIALLLRAGMSYADAQTLVYLLAFLVFLVVFCWSYAARSIARVWLALLGGGVVMTGLAWLLTRSLA